MGSGAPDHQIQARSNIIQQDLTRLVQRPSYGGAQVSNGSVGFAGGANPTITAISGKGIIYGGFLTSIGSVSQRLDTVRLDIDGTQISLETFRNHQLWGVDQEHSKVTYILKYDNTDFIYTVGLSGGITFETSFTVIYKNNTATLTSLHWEFLFALV